MQLKFKLDYTESPFWAIDDEAKVKFGHNVALNQLNLKKNTITRVKSISQLFQQRLNLVHQSFPSFWSGRMYVFFQLFLKQVYTEIEYDLLEKYELINDEYYLMNQEIDVEQIDKELKEFLDDPSKLADAKGITYLSEKALKEEIKLAYQKWERIEFTWITY